MRLTLLALIILLVLPLQAQNPITIDELKQHVYFLADDTLEGRKPGTPGGDKAAEYIRNYFKDSGLELLVEDGFQKFELISTVELGTYNMLAMADREFVLSEDYTPLWFSKSAKVEAPVVFTGYGFMIDEEKVKWNDYDGLDVSGKWVLVLLGDPEPDNPHSSYGFHSRLRKKAQVASDQGAAGVLCVAGPEWDEEDELPSLRGRYEAIDKIPVIRIKREVANLLLGEKGDVADLENKLNTSKQPSSFELDVSIAANTDLELKYDTTYNVAAFLPGTDEALKDEIIVIGAHYDHLGYGGPGSGSRAIDTLAIHNGADDNASGVAGLLEIAEYMATSTPHPKRSILFLAFGAEEKGLLGSKHYVENPIKSLDDVRLMFNLDMIGRLESDKGLTVGGTGTSAMLDSLVMQAAGERGIDVKTQNEGSGPSDHASFYRKEKPVLFFFSGTHQDYHKPSDDADKVNFAGLLKIATMVSDLALDQANSAEQLAFQEAGPKERSMRTRFKVTFGVMPDYASDAEGMRLDDVREEGPAGKAGMQGGDVIISIGGKKIANIYDYMNRLADLNKGELVEVKVLRDDEEIALKVQL